MKALSGQDVDQKRIIVVFRYDDYSRQSSTTFALKLISTFRRHRASVTFSVIPFLAVGDARDPNAQEPVPLTSTEVDILADAVRDGTVEIALHGYTHESTSSMMKSEFAGLDCNSQMERISRGKQLLETLTGAPVTTFVPPWNRYDLNTLHVLQRLGFSILSANAKGEAELGSVLKYIPETCGLPDLRAAVTAARKSPEALPVVVVCFHAYDFRELSAERGRITYQEFSQELDRLASQRDVRVLSIAGAAQSLVRSGADTYQLNKLVLSAQRLLPPFLQTQYGNLYNRSVGVFLRVVLRLAGLQLTIAALVALTAIMVEVLIFNRSAALSLLAACLSSIGLLFVVMYARRDSHIYYWGLMASSAMLGACVGTWLRFLYLR